MQNRFLGPQDRPRAAKSRPRAAQRSPKTTPRTPKSGQEQPKSGPRAAETPLRPSQEAPRGPKTASRTRQERPRPPKSGPRPHQERPRALQDRPTLKKGSRDPPQKTCLSKNGKRATVEGASETLSGYPFKEFLCWKKCSGHCGLGPTVGSKQIYIFWPYGLEISIL